jgi:hypothetical protein
MLEKLKFGTYIFFAAFCLIMFLWVLFFVPETRYKTLEEMDEVFGDHGPGRLGTDLCPAGRHGSGCKRRGEGACGENCLGGIDRGGERCD